jgi:riboflavin kinase/FMN adenylyltransferase
MEIIKGLDFWMKESSVSLGKFDGIHQGHRSLLKNVLQQEKLIPTVFTFESNPAVSKIYTQEEKNWILDQMGIKREIIFPFNEETKHMAPEEFIDEILIKRMDVRHICVGTDFRFGRNREGDIHTLERFQDKYHYRLSIIPKLTLKNEIISSTLIRNLMDQGNLPRVNELLGAPYFVMGEVLHGNALGRTMNMPTANILPDGEKKLLPYGVYATIIQVRDKQYFGVTNVGKKPTIGEYAVGVETFIMDFQENIYGETIQVFFHDFIREERKFDGIEALHQQIEKDKETARRLLTERFL